LDCSPVVRFRSAGSIFEEFFDFLNECVVNCLGADPEALCLLSL
jgi:hypothetical protein